MLRRSCIYLSLLVLTRLVHPDWWWQNAEPRSISPSPQTVPGQPWRRCLMVWSHLPDGLRSAMAVVYVGPGTALYLFLLTRLVHPRLVVAKC